MDGRVNFNGWEISHPFSLNLHQIIDFINRSKQQGATNGRRSNRRNAKRHHRASRL